MSSDHLGYTKNEYVYRRFVLTCIVTADMTGCLLYMFYHLKTLGTEKEDDDKTYYYARVI